MDTPKETTPEVAVKDTEPTIAEVAGKEQVAPEPKEATVGEALKSEKKDDSVPLSTFLEMKKSNKEMQKQMKELQKSIEAGSSSREVNTDIKALADKHGVDSDFLDEFAAAVRAQNTAEMESKLAPMKQKERAAKIDATFNKHFKKAMERLPELEGVVNKDVIKTLSLAANNSNKTFIQLIEDTYGNTVQGRRSIDSASTRAGKNDSLDVDTDRAKKDPAYLKEVLSNPTLKAKYNKDLINRVSQYI
jgi:uncharacterized protein YfcZ (UPF0381/DUF406 family)